MESFRRPVARRKIVTAGSRTTPATSRAAILAGTGLALWAVAVIVLGLRGAFIQRDYMSVPPMGIALLVIAVTLIVALRASTSLRSLLTNQRHLIGLNV
jgi:hypothetical protein